MEVILQIKNEEGMHARPAGVLVKKASAFQSKIDIKAKGQVKSARSIMGIMSLGLQFNDDITIVAEGSDAPQAIEALTQLVNARFAEGE